jgi:predicted nucleotidyltransferase component of viral defense system
VINRQDVFEFSRELGLRPDIVEKDYVLGWVLAGIFAHPPLQQAWIFKGGTCLKKCFFETYRFSEDLDFTLSDSDHLDERYLLDAFTQIARWVYEQSGIEIPQEGISFEFYENPRGRVSVQGRMSYRGPLMARGSLPRIKLDLTDDELVVLDPVIREVHHPYPDRPGNGIRTLCYAYEELFAEKVRALAERERPRDLYDVIHLYRHVNSSTDRGIILDVLKRKCEYKTIALPSMAALESQPARAELEAEWENMLGHQLPMLPPFDQFWQELPVVLDWIYREVTRVAEKTLPYGPKEDSTWRPPAMGQPWGPTVRTRVPLEIIRFAAANHLCVDLAYQGSTRLIEPYSLRRTKDGNLLLHAIRHDRGEHRAYRVDEIQGASVSKVTFVPRYAIELTATGPLSVPPAYRKEGITKPYRSSVVRRSSSGPTHVIGCPVCGKHFNHKSRSVKLNKHKDRSGYPCAGRTGYLVEIR